MSIDQKATDLAIARIKKTDENEEPWILVHTSKDGQHIVTGNGTYRQTIDLLTDALAHVHKAHSRSMRKVGKTVTGRFSSKTRVSNTKYICPHGHTESNDCPDCCH